ncbi:SPOR domain-containing protein [Thermomonas sp. XSG]|jgi:cell division protein FtsN|uniref:SPOR domain-containing protein n=1 Tax=Thermomonas sp. XSG TaxID=2771436 RepID=UPI0016804496|nr:SPOR domain-containing protein [Thermomonas sp. XSG]QNU14864.1 sporulation protein [Thermomonas sp. XSG]
MAARRGKSQAKRNSSGGLPGWAWLVIGVLLTLLAVLLLPRYLKSDGSDGFFRPKPNPDALPAAVSDEGEAIAPDTAPAGEGKADADKPKPTQYDFYTLLPGQEVAVSDAELAASAKAEAEAQANAARQASAAETAPAAASSPDALPTPLGETPAAATPAPTAAATASAEAARTAPATRYILQAGAFGASGDAEATKARIALLGLNARVESAQIDGKTVYRVRMGPYGSASELADAKAKLAGSGLPAMAVKTH